MIQATNEEFQELADALLSASHLLLRQRIRGDLEPAAFAVLCLVCRSAAVRPSDVAGSMRLDQSTISRHIQALESAGYVAKIKDAQDGRSYRLKVTAAGRPAMSQAAVRRAEYFRKAAARWTKRDLRTLVGLLARLATDLKACADAEEDSPERMSRRSALKGGGIDR
jgi:DNA-binding MarR family transcriptional regulator